MTIIDIAKLLIVAGLFLFVVGGAHAAVEEVPRDYFTQHDAVVIDFEDAELFPESQYARTYGVKFNGPDSQAVRINDNNRRGDETISGQYSIMNDALFPKTSVNVPFVLSFADVNSVSAVGFYMGNGNDYGESVTATITVLGAENRILGIVNRTNVSNPVTTFVGVKASERISKVLIDYGNTLLSEDIDDVMFVGEYEHDQEREVPTNGRTESNFTSESGLVRISPTPLEPKKIYDVPDPSTLSAKLDARRVTLDTSYKYFIADGKFNGYLVVGAAASSTDTLAMNDVSLAFADSGFKVARAVLQDLEVKDLNRNMIVIGRTCENAIALELVGKDLCKGGLEPETGMIAVFEKQGGVQVLITGYSKEDVQRAASVYAKYVKETLAQMGSSKIFIPKTFSIKLYGERMYVVGTDSNLKVVAGLSSESTTSESTTAVSPEPRSSTLIENQDDSTEVMIASNSENSDGTSNGDFTENAFVRYPIVCESGCSFDGRCLPIGTRLAQNENVFCSVEGMLKVQQKLETSCQNNFECGSNQCANSRCVDLEEKLAEAHTLFDTWKQWFAKWLK